MISSPLFDLAAARRSWLLAAVLLTSSAFSPPVTAQSPSADAWLADEAARRGLDFVHDNGMSGELYFPEMTGQGGAFLDYDLDGDLDVYLVEGGPLGKAEAQGGGEPRGDRLYRNDSRAGADGALDSRFVDVTAASGLRAQGYGMGVTVGDYDNDGDPDLYLTNYGSNQLWRNEGDGTFREVTAAAGVDDPRWSTSALFADLDGDGWLDLYVGAYVEFSVESNPVCYAESSRRDYCGPSAFRSLPDRLFRNRGDGTFEDVTTASGIGRQAGAALGAVAADLNGDGLLDLYVANDGEPNFLWQNAGDGTFVDEALLAGVAVNRQGQPEASMGIDAGDFDADGDEDLFMTHLAAETNTLFVNDGTGLFEDRTIETGLAAGGLAFTSFGTAWTDLDNDGWLDLFIANGAVRIQEAKAEAGSDFPLDQPNQLFRNRGGRRFEELSGAPDGVVGRSEVSRGLAVGDVDNDGDLDLLLTNNNGPVRLLINRVGSAAGWLAGSDRRGPGGGPRLGSRWGVTTEVGTLWRRVRTDGSYCSAHDPRLAFGLGAVAAQALTVRGTDGRSWRLESPPVGRFVVLTAKDADG